MTTIMHSKKIKIVLSVLGGLVVVFLSFGAGMAVGYWRGIFASRFGENYMMNFRGRGGMGMFPGGPPPLNQYGMEGTVIGVNPSSSIIDVEGPSGDEGSVAVAKNTVIREKDRTIPLDAIAPGNIIVVIGDPDGQGQVLARFIRVFTSTSSIPQWQQFSGPPLSQTSSAPSVPSSSSAPSVPPPAQPQP